MAPSNLNVSPPLVELNGILVMLVLIELVRNEMMVAFPLTADGTKWEPWTWMAGLSAAAQRLMWITAALAVE